MINHSEKLTQAAIAIWEGGACNPRALIRQLVEIVAEACTEKGSSGVRESVEFRLVLAQLLWIIFGSDPYSNRAVFEYPCREDQQSVRILTHSPFDDIEVLRQRSTSSQHEWLQILLEEAEKGK